MPEHLLIANGKGGVGKTSVAANLAAIWAATGRRVLLIDTDPQGNAAVQLGLAEHDSGRGLHLAVIGGTAAAPVLGVRDNLDLVPGGDELDALNAALAARQARHRHGALDAIVAALHATGASYDLVIIDTAPAGGVLIDGLISGADWVLIPTKPDELSLLGLARVATRVGELADQGRPVAQLLGVVLFAISTQATGLRRETRATLDELLPGTGGKVFNAVIRASERAAVDQSGTGLVASEYQAAAEALHQPWYQNRDAPRFAAGASALAADYAELADEVLHDISARRQQVA
jgi:cellulose biosynthesis protein BcsQ